MLLATFHTIKFSTKFFDVLGRAYDKMKANIKYYVLKEAIENKRKVALEFEVYMRIIEDSDGNDVRVFVKKDERHGFRKDSSFYYNGYWEVFEFDDAGRETRFRTASGISSISRYDDRERLKEYYRIDGKGDTLESQQYEWKNGRLVRMTANGLVRNYIYGKTLRDTVRVEPSDEGFNYHRGYNGTAGKIPEEGTSGYETFSRNPYGHMHFGEVEEESLENDFVSKSFVLKKSNSLNVLAKAISYDCIREEYKIDSIPPQCIKFTENDVIKNSNALTRLFGYPSENGRPTYGRSDAKLSLKFECQCNSSGKYQLSFSGKAIDKEIEVYQNFWRYSYEKESWYERCWDKVKLPETYKHEIQHIENAMHKANALSNEAKKDSSSSRKECDKNGIEESKRLEKKWNEWYKMEMDHRNQNSPTYSGERNEYICL